MNWKSKWMGTKNKSKISAWILILMMMVSLINPLPVWAATMDVDPDTVTEQEGFDQQFTLTLTEDTFQSTVSSEHVELGGDFQSLSVGEVVYSDSTTVTTRVYGDLYSDNGIGTIKIYSDALVGESDIVAEIRVDSTGSTGGSGTAEDPYQISDASQLNMVRHDLNAHYKLVNDIDLGVAPYNQGQGWEPIGTKDDPFTGGFDGNGHTISNLYIDRDTDYVGLFGAFQNADIKNVVLENVNVTGKDWVGGLVGAQNNGTISNSHATGDVQGNEKVGGLVGDSASGQITNSYATTDIEGSKSVGGLVGYSVFSQITNSYATGNVAGNNYDHAGGLVGFFDRGEIINSHAAGNVTSSGNSDGGLVGYLYESSIENSYATGDVKGNNYVGGLVGQKTFCDIENSYATGTVKGNSEVGGLVGYSHGTITNSYATGSVEGNNYVGGLVGYNSSNITNSYTTGSVEGTNEVGGLAGYSSGNITKSHATGTVKGNSEVGGLVGYRYDTVTITNSFYNLQTTGQENAVGYGSADGVTGLTIDQMKEQDSFGGWDFPAVWQIEENITYPYLAWQNDNKDFAPPVFADGYPQTENVTHNGLDLLVQVDEDATAYYMVFLEGTDTGTGDFTPVQSGDFELTGGTVETATVTGLDPEMSYDIYVGIEDTAGNPQPDILTSMVQATTTSAPDTTPPTVADGTIGTSSLTDAEVTLNWNKATDNESPQETLQYLVYRSNSNNIDTVENMEVNGTAEGTYAADIDTKEITGLTGSTTYYFNVIVKDEDGNKTAYTMKEVTTSAQRRSGGSRRSRRAAPADSDSKFIRSGTGGSVSFGNATVEIPAESLPDNATFKVEKLTEREAEDLIPSGLRVKIGSDVYEITTSGEGDFGENTIAIKIAFDSDQISEGEEPVIHYYDEETEEWTSLETTVEQGVDEKWYAMVEVNHLTKFAVFSTEVEEKEIEQKVILLTLDKKMVTVDGSQFLLDASPYIDAAANRTLVPIRFVSEALKASVDWNPETRQVTITDGNKEIVLTIGSSNVLVNREEQTMDCTPSIHPPGRTFVPVRFISEHLGAQVAWNPATREITITR